MTLLEFLRQWQRGRLSAAVVASVLLHVLLVVALIGVKPSRLGFGTKPGDALLVDLRSEPEPARAGAPGATVSPPPAPRSAPPAAKPAPAPIAAAKAPPRVTPPAAPPVPPEPAPRPAPVAAAPPVGAEPTPHPAAATPAPATAPEPSPRLASAPPASVEPSPARAASPSSSADAPQPAERAHEREAAAPAPSPGRQVAAAPPTGEGRAFVPDLRSLRNGGVYGGGAEGRGGVEGDPVSLDNPDPKYADYLLRVKRQIEDKMTYPCVKDPTTKVCEPKAAQLVIEFGIRKDGQLAFVQLREAAQYAIFDDVSQNAVKLASPFPPLPDAIRAAHPTGLPISAHFRYDYTLSFRSIVR